MKDLRRFADGCGVILYFPYFLYEFGVSKGFGNEYNAISLWQFIRSLFG